jgi:Na+/H+ antiporter NhaA
VGRPRTRRPATRTRPGGAHPRAAVVVGVVDQVQPVAQDLPSALQKFLLTLAVVDDPLAISRISERTIHPPQMKIVLI